MSQVNGSILVAADRQSSQITSQVDLLISLHLHLWPALTVAIQNAWGTSSIQISEDKRDWLAGAISDLFAQNQVRDVEDLEDILDQVMSDEFEVVVDDGTVEEVAHKIWKGVERVKSGNMSEVQELMQEWECKKGKGINIIAGPDQNQDASSDDDDAEWNGFEDNDPALHGTDIDMDEAPALVDVSRNKKQEPEVDDDGFTKVVGRKKR